jgi:hypothetical protein
MRIGLMIGTATASVVVALGLATGTAGAAAYPYCAIAGGNPGYENCHYPNFGACMAAFSAVGGFCQPNPRFVGYSDPRDDQPPRRRSPRVPR